MTVKMLISLGSILIVTFPAWTGCSGYGTNKRFVFPFATGSLDPHPVESPVRRSETDHHQLAVAGERIGPDLPRTGKVGCFLDGIALA